MSFLALDVDHEPDVEMLYAPGTLCHKSRRDEGRDHGGIKTLHRSGRASLQSRRTDPR